jgi:hypothetical protein
MLIKIFQENTKGTFQFLQNFQLRFNLIFCEEIFQYLRTFASQVQTSWNRAHAPLLVKSFLKILGTWSEASWFGGSHNYKRKENKLPSFIDRCQNLEYIFGATFMVKLILHPTKKVIWLFHSLQVICFLPTIIHWSLKWRINF